MDPVLPKNLEAFYAVISSPVTAGIVLSMLLESLPQIQSDAVAAWKKAIACVLVGIAWAVFVTAIGPTGLPTSPNGWYTLFATALAVVFSMNVWHKVVIKGFPALQDFLLALFNPSSLTIQKTVASSDGTMAQSSTVTKTTVPDVTPVTLPIGIDQPAG